MRLASRWLCVSRIVYLTMYLTTEPGVGLLLSLPTALTRCAPMLQVMRPQVPLYMGLSLSLPLHGPGADWAPVLEVRLHLVIDSSLLFWIGGLGLRIEVLVQGSGFGV